MASWHKAHRDSIAYLLLCELGLEKLDFTKNIIRDSALYMVYKVLSIASKYPSYYKYEDFGNLESYFKEESTIPNRFAILLMQLRKTSLISQLSSDR